ncbi:hypothetical protein BCD48_41845 [Pseudofrankia sp. BMG5.36]|nr:hypothetical protein BCD48_41845 [Pseudofrankia sp. BMG5.36]
MREQRLEGELGEDGGVVGVAGLSAWGGVGADGGQGPVDEGGDRPEVCQEGVADQDVVDEFLASFVDPGVPPVRGDRGGEVPQPLGAALVGAG